MTALDRVLEALTERDCKPRGSGRQWQARCPAHDDHDPSLSVTEGDGRVALVKCHAGCQQADVVAALGLAFGDLHPVVEPLIQQSVAEPDWVDPGTLDLWLDACHDALLSSEAARLARRYLRRRGVSGDLVRHYGLGFGVSHTDRRLDWLRGRIVVGASYRHVEGRAIPNVSCNRPEVRWLSAIGSKKGCSWWRVGDVDPGFPVVAVEGPLDVLALHAITGGNALGTLGKGNVSEPALRRLQARGVRQLLLGLDRDATVDQWRAFVDVGAKHGIEVTPLVGPASGDWGDLLLLAEDDYWQASSEALTTPVAEVPA